MKSRPTTSLATQRRLKINAGFIPFSDFMLLDDFSLLSHFRSSDAKKSGKIKQGKEKERQQYFISLILTGIFVSFFFCLALIEGSERIKSIFLVLSIVGPFFIADPSGRPLKLR